MAKGGISTAITVLGFLALCVLLLHGLASAASTGINTDLYELRASDAQDYDRLGSSLAVDRDLAVFGASGGNAAYVFQRHSDGTWNEVKRLVASETSDPVRFGWTVDIAGNTIVVGADETKIAYIFERATADPDSWSEVKKLAAGWEPKDGNGFAVAIDQNTLVIGYPKTDTTCCAYVHERDKDGSDNWGRVATLSAGEAGVRSFGGAVAISADMIAVVAEDASGHIVVYLFQRDHGGQDKWGKFKKLTLDDDSGEEDVYEAHNLLALEHNTLIVGAYDASVSVGDTMHHGQGVAYIFERNFGGAGNWGRVKKLVASDGHEYQWFGFSVALNSDKALVGAVWADVGDNDRQGTAYIYQRDAGGPGNWGEVEKLSAATGAARAYFGAAVAKSINADLIGAPGSGFGGGESQGQVHYSKRFQPQYYAWLPIARDR